MVNATIAQAKLSGQWVERSEQVHKQIDDMTDQELLEILHKGMN